ncbi:hypothetical protein ACH4ZX_31820 [Streptomyces sp. NPDC020490]|uniref:hypothetical protein n=1 Tax=Streptomyces sp. NPDC020490 TaxID=3365078 RepID=UPI0037B7A680
MSNVVVTLAGADSPGEHLQLAALTTLGACFFLWAGRKQRRTGRSIIAPSETIRVADVLIPPTAPTRGRRVAGCAWIVVGSVFVVPAVFNTVAAIYELLG